MYMSVMQLDLSNCLMRNPISENEEVLHQLLMKSANNIPRQDSHLLYRKEKDKLCVYSDAPLQYNVLEEHGYLLQDVKLLDNLYGQIQNGDVVKCFFRTVPSKKVKREGKRNSARISLHQRCERLAWVEKKLFQNGAMVEHTIDGTPLIIEDGFCKIQFSHFANQTNFGAHILTAYNYIATVKITDKDSFFQVLQDGIGHYKSYGCGLILVGAT